MDKKDYKYILKRVITFFIIFVILSFIKSCEVKAESIGGFYVGNDSRQMQVSPYARFYSLNGRNATASGTGSNTQLGAFGTDDNVTQSGSGELLCFDFNELLKSGVTYSISIYLGGASSNNYFKENVNDPNVSVSYSLGAAQSNWTNQDYKVTTVSHTATSGTIPIYYRDPDGSTGLENTSLYTNILEYIITPSIEATSICVPFNSVTATYTSSIYYYGYNIDSLGNLSTLTSSQVQNIINNSGLATANSVSQVQTAITNMQTSISNSIDAQSQQQHQDSVNTQNAINNAASQAHQDSQAMQNTITDTSSPSNLNGLSQSAGWLPAGPVDSILNLPLSLLNNISDNLSKSCQPVILTLPYVNSTLTLPCLNTLYDQMGVGPLLSFVGTIVSCFILLSYLLKLYKWVDDTLTFRENNYIDNWGGI